MDVTQSSMLSLRLIQSFRSVILTIGVFTVSLFMNAQAAPTASRIGDLQVGAAFNLAVPDYGSNLLRGVGIYATVDIRRHWGVEGAFHQLNDTDSKVGIYERTFEVGPRYVLHFDRLSPYAKFMIGRGVFQFPPDSRHPENGSVANLAYNMWAGGIGADYHLGPSTNLRLDYELQNWNAFPPHGLNPQVLSIGVAYRFH
ncbi:outer membrane beta-barrel protein [Granulicella sp. dw_53]|uniref:outer membrane beta-barrel protein n=1 Tax=Granulicella sp. dw_53 TaxID=2719792 RepID=UPI001BD6B759|nr:outer membrane beta-barrel protein [Granulicella sp. dw_53]